VAILILIFGDEVDSTSFLSISVFPELKEFVFDLIQSELLLEFVIDTFYLSSFDLRFVVVCVLVEGYGSER